MTWRFSSEWLACFISIYLLSSLRIKLQFSNHERYIFRTHFISHVIGPLIGQRMGADASDWRPAAHSTLSRRDTRDMSATDYPGVCPGHRSYRSYRSCQETGGGQPGVSQTEVTVKAALGWGDSQCQCHVWRCNVITTWDSVMQRILRRVVTRPRLRQKKRSSIQKMRDLGNKKWTAVFMFSLTCTLHSTKSDDRNCSSSHLNYFVISRDCQRQQWTTWDFNL